MLKVVALLIVAIMLMVAGCAKQDPTPNKTENPPTGMRRNFAQGEVGNAGHGYYKNGQLFLVDLVEAGLENVAPLQNEEEGKRCAVKRLIKLEARNAHPVFTSPEFCTKMAQILYIEPVLGRSIIESINMYEWVPIQQHFKTLPLKGSILDIKDEDLVMVASRVGRRVTLSAPAMSMMNAVNQGATIIHEMVSALITPQQTGKDGKIFEQSGVRARQIVAVIYGPDFNGKLMYDGFHTALNGNELPYNDGTPQWLGVNIQTTTESLFKFDPGAAPVILKAVNLKGRVKGTEKATVLFDTESAGREFKVDRKAIAELCRERLASNEAIELLLGLSAVYDHEKYAKNTTAMKLSFATFRDEKEEKTYVKHERIKYDQQPVKYVSALNLSQEDCEVKVRTEVWKAAATMYAGRSFATEAETDGILNRVLEEMGR